MFGLGGASGFAALGIVGNTVVSDENSELAFPSLIPVTCNSLWFLLGVSIESVT